MTDAIYNAIRTGDSKKLKALLDSQGIEDIIRILDDVAPDGDAAIHAAVKKEDLEMIELLAERHCDLNVLNAHRRTALMMAVEKGSQNIALFLCQKGADVNVAGHNGNTALHLAAMKGNIDMVSLLLGPNCKKDSLNSEGETAVFIAVDKGFLDIVQLLCLSGANLSISQNDGGNVIIQAAKTRNIKCLKYFFKQFNKNKPLPDINSLNSQGLNALMYATIDRNIEIVKILISHGANVNLQNPNNGQTCLHLGALNGDSDVVEALIAAGACLNVVNHYLETPLSRANKCIKKRLIDAGAYEFRDHQIGMPVFPREGSIHSGASNQIHNEIKFPSIEIDSHTVNETHLIQTFSCTMEEAEDSKDNADDQLKISESQKSAIDQYRLSKKFKKALKDCINKFLDSHSNSGRVESDIDKPSKIFFSEHMKVVILRAENVIFGDNHVTNSSKKNPSNKMRPLSFSESQKTFSEFGGSSVTLNGHEQHLKDAEDELEAMATTVNNVHGPLATSRSNISEAMATSNSVSDGFLIENVKVQSGCSGDDSETLTMSKNTWSPQRATTISFTSSTGSLPGRIITDKNRKPLPWERREKS
ncbi:NF-kappa-B inhibitor epsilon [Biomphalaria glabrata]|uniref:Uncharacterized protein LOC106065744 n=2 Tax=Biomphalaria glabrata TaxID=6526 RepID=A0A9W3B623_BIOGL|nr:uncharacterized protein LOC106065744 [Biomphalaria glabrata]XP_055894959.1 uncharacterized protein LOC106065744 [Biomphalaria glabrata]XP_055894960.1 uncharacterized protein LOC106065744 [Biomphalaria glabrata]XP_055894961.1 uncharacterized protein LOC106065744 [Biomphalaria glabrata]XP_055894962.1 uncharacterized protein LOC106065744 [Biomphalaria glabrata]KAI8734260.1 NF-kappa-B inhibitor epsilon-like; partial [Biomphalaria glabrata]